MMANKRRPVWVQSVKRSNNVKFQIKVMQCSKLNFKRLPDPSQRLRWVLSILRLFIGILQISMIPSIRSRVLEHGKWWLIIGGDGINCRVASGVSRKLFNGGVTPTNGTDKCKIQAGWQELSEWQNWKYFWNYFGLVITRYVFTSGNTADVRG